MNLRAARDGDGPAIIELITSCWHEYPGVFMDVDGENPELRVLATYFTEAGGAFWVAESAGRLCGTVGTKPTGGGAWELCRMYVADDMRGNGLANRLFNTAADHARAHGGTRLHLWTDTRFDRAHRFYERVGLVRDGGIKPLMDASNSLEFGYAKPLVGVVTKVLDAAAAASASRSLGRILQACVTSGASVSFLPPLSQPAAHRFFQGIATDVAIGKRILLAAWVDGTLAGTASVNLDMPQNQSHRAEVQKLLVDPSLRRRGVARMLMQAAERAAQQADRSLLTLDTREGDFAEALYRATGWAEAGRIPDFASNADGSLCATVMFYKSLPG